ncbi:MAG TPA: SDR family NAD(P)-dependent oxidoreductase, partial [Candidatus Luteococcus avicola]|nr:SDR family NAD(P)-dependent oxidoreductase [Candidatus Luteococcus avicola]
MSDETSTGSSRPTNGSRPTALVTGASRGIGLAIARRLSDTHHILVGGRDRAAVAAVVAELPSAEPFVCDLDDEQAVASAVTDITSLDVLVHSAGIAASGRVGEAERDTWRRVYETNVVAVAGLTRLLLPALRAAKGQVVTINSGAGFNSGPGGGA